MKGMKIYGSFYADSYQVSIDWLAVTLKYDNHGGGAKAMLLARIIGTKVRDRYALHWT